MLENMSIFNYVLMGSHERKVSFTSNRQPPTNMTTYQLYTWIAAAKPGISFKLNTSIQQLFVALLQLNTCFQLRLHTYHFTRMLNLKSSEINWAQFKVLHGCT